MKLLEKKSKIKVGISVLLSISIILTMVFTMQVTQAFAAGSVVAANGQLKVVGSQLCNSSGQPIQLKGMSTHGLQWFGSFANANSIKWIRDDWGATVIRAAMYTAEGGYISNPTTSKNKVKEIVQAAIDLGIYVIIDWHILSDNDPNLYKQQAKDFFKEMSALYGSYPNVLYEICNEPNGGVTWSQNIKPYAQEVIPVIRANDPDGVIIVGTSTWSQDIDAAADNKLTFSNVMYTCHFYAGTHGQSLRDKIDYAMSKGAAIFVTEWGTSDASGNGGPYLTDSKTWLDFLASRKISWANWSLCDKSEASAALNPGASVNGGWTDSNLSASGKFVKSNMKGGAVTSSTPTSTPVVTATKAPTATPVVTATKAPTATPIPSSTVKPSSTPVTSASPAANGLKVQLYNGSLTASANIVSPKFKIINTKSTSINLSDVKLRYFYTVDGDTTQTFTCDYATAGSANVVGTFVKMSAPKTGADYYLEISFKTGSGTLAPGASAEVQVRFNKSNWANYTQTGDYSYNSAATSYVDWTKVAAYSGTQLVWGTNP
ncbi:MAG: cellulase family glycosylhydrolase [Bacillota bacterium]|nr:cellulase family glycosylhydrolase [Bacillota bacterium]